MYKVIFFTVFVLLTIVLSFTCAQTSGKDKSQKASQTDASNILDNKSGEATNSSELVDTNNSQTGNPNAKQVEKAVPKPTEKPKPKQKPKARRRRPRRRKRPRRRQRQPKRKQNVQPKPTEKPQPKTSKNQEKPKEEPQPKTNKNQESPKEEPKPKTNKNQESPKEEPQPKTNKNQESPKEEPQPKTNKNQESPKEELQPKTNKNQESPKENPQPKPNSKNQAKPMEKPKPKTSKNQENTKEEPQSKTNSKNQAKPVENTPPSKNSNSQTKPREKSQPEANSNSQQTQQTETSKNSQPNDPSQQQLKANEKVKQEAIAEKSVISKVKKDMKTNAKEENTSIPKPAELKDNTNTATKPQAQKQEKPIVNAKSKIAESGQKKDNKTQQDNKPKAERMPKPANKPKPANNPNPLSKRKNKPKPDKKPKNTKPKQDNVFQDHDGFFDLFFETTTTVNLEPPPDFDPNEKPAKKVLPQVDPSKAIAHDGTPCAENYKEHPTDKTKYMMRLPENVWQAVDCPPNLSQGLVWRQDLCNCGEELVPQDPNDACGLQGYNPYPNNRHKYMRRHHGINNVMDCPANLIWSQKVCLCLFDPDAIKPIEPTVTFVCKTILNLTFEDRLQNTAEGYYVKPVEFGRRSKIPRIRYVKTPGADGLAAQIVSQPLQFQAFRGNDFQKQVTISLNFKVSGRRKKSKNFMLLLTDECEQTQSGINKQWEPSISLSFQPSTQTFQLLFRTEQNLIEQNITGAQPDHHGWYKVVVYFEDRTVNLENNGQKLFTVGNVQGNLPPNRCPLYIAGRGKGYDKSQNFYGYMDNIFLVKDCKFHESNIKIL